MCLIAARPTRLYCPTCEQVYNVPQVPRPPPTPAPLFPHTLTLHTPVTAMVVHQVVFGRIPLTNESHCTERQSTLQRYRFAGTSFQGLYRSASCPFSRPSANFSWSARVPSSRRITSTLGCSHQRSTYSSGADMTRLEKVVSACSQRNLLGRLYGSHTHCSEGAQYLWGPQTQDRPDNSDLSVGALPPVWWQPGAGLHAACFSPTGRLPAPLALLWGDGSPSCWPTASFSLKN